ncbi:hypothetical protein BDV11DRAFT_181212 [Aspergillus similis]
MVDGLRSILRLSRRRTIWIKGITNYHTLAACSTSTSRVNDDGSAYTAGPRLFRWI